MRICVTTELENIGNSYRCNWGGGGYFLMYDFWTPPYTINFVHASHVTHGYNCLCDRSARLPSLSEPRCSAQKLNIGTRSRAILLTGKPINTYYIRIYIYTLGIRINTYFPYVCHTYFCNHFLGKNTYCKSVKIPI